MVAAARYDRLRSTLASARVRGATAPCRARRARAPTIVPHVGDHQRGPDLQARERRAEAVIGVHDVVPARRGVEPQHTQGALRVAPPALVARDVEHVHGHAQRPQPLHVGVHVRAVVRAARVRGVAVNTRLARRC